MRHDFATVATAGIVTLAFLALVALLVWRLTETAPRRGARTLFAVAAVLANLPALPYAFLNVPG